MAILTLIAALLLGVTFGTFTGIIPGIHINLVAALLLASINHLQGISSLALAVFITSISITHIFLDFIPSILLGAPEEDTALAVLPGHEMLKEGKGYEAIVLSVSGALSALPIILIVWPIFILFLPSIFPIFKDVIPFSLIFLSLYLIFREREFIVSLVVFILASFLGLISFNLPIQEPLLPMLTGLFGISSLFISLKSKTIIKPQKIAPLKEIYFTKKDLFKSFVASFIVAPLCSFLPGIGSNHAAALSSEIIPQGNRGFLFLIGSINTIIMSLSFVTIYAIGKARSGAAAAVEEILKEISLQNIYILLISIVLTACISFFISINLAKLSTLFINRLNYQKLTFSIIIFLFFINFLLTNWIGLIVLITSCYIGIFCILSNVRRINLMGALIVPAVVYYLIN